MTSILRLDFVDPLFEKIGLQPTHIKSRINNTNDELLKKIARVAIKSFIMFSAVVLLASPAIIFGGAIGVGVGLSAALVMAAVTGILEWQGKGMFGAAQDVGREAVSALLSWSD